MKKVFLWVGYVFTLGALAIFIRKKSKFSGSTGLLNFKVKKIINLLGGSHNIREVCSSNVTLKVFFYDVKYVNTEKLKAFCDRGTILSSNCVTILLGDNSQAFAQKISEELKNGPKVNS